jgi:hypothetical protein
VLLSVDVLGSYYLTERDYVTGYWDFENVPFAVHFFIQISVWTTLFDYIFETFSGGGFKYICSNASLTMFVAMPLFHVRFLIIVLLMSPTCSPKAYGHDLRGSAHRSSHVLSYSPRRLILLMSLCVYAIIIIRILLFWLLLLLILPPPSPCVYVCVPLFVQLRGIRGSTIFL